MAKQRIITYECEECGSEIVVNPVEGMQLSPIYCCGVQVTEISSGPEEPAPKKKIKAKPAAKRITAKKPSAKKGPAKKKTAKK